MYIVTNEKTLNDLPLALSEVKGILYTRLIEFFSEYNVDDISSFGAFIILQKDDEINDYKQMKLTEPITEDNIEWVEVLEISKETYYNICVVRDNDYAVNIFISKSLISDKTEKIIKKVAEI